MKKLILALAALMFASCSTTYYLYYEVDSPDDASAVSKWDGAVAKNHKSPTRCIAAYPDSTGKTVYLMESLTKPSSKWYYSMLRGPRRKRRFHPR